LRVFPKFSGPAIEFEYAQNKFNAQAMFQLVNVAIYLTTFKWYFLQQCVVRQKLRNLKNYTSWNLMWNR